MTKIMAPMKARTVPALFVLCMLASACSVAGPAPTPEGHELFQLCSQCHGPTAAGNRAVNAPEIAGLPQWYIEAQLKKFKQGGRGTHFDDLTGMQMRPMAMSLATDAEIAVVSEYVSKLPVVKPAAELKDGNAEHGKTLFATCLACHGPQAGGMEAMKAPPLNHASDWYLFASLKKFKAGIRGTNPLDVSGATMRPMSQTLVDEQAMKDVIAHIGTLQQ